MTSAARPPSSLVVAGVVGVVGAVGVVAVAAVGGSGGSSSNSRRSVYCQGVRDPCVDYDGNKAPRRSGIDTS